MMVMIHDTNPLLHLYHFRKKYNYILANIYSESSSMERHSCLIRLLGMMIFQVRLYATELQLLYLVRFTSVIIVSYIVTRF